MPYLKFKSCSLQKIREIIEELPHVKKRESYNVVRQVKFPLVLENQTNYDLSCLPLNILEVANIRLYF